MPTQTIEVLRIPGTLFPRGPFDENASYKFLNIVESGGSGYVCLQPCTGIPVTNTAYWFKFCFKGDKGDAFTYADLTAEQKAELVRDATAAAQAAATSAQSAADDAAAALQKFNTIKAAIDAIDPQSTEGSIQTLAAKQGLLEADINALGPEIDNIKGLLNGGSVGPLVTESLTTTWTEGKSISVLNGSEINSESSSCSGFIDISKASGGTLTYTRPVSTSSSPTVGLVFYTSEKSMISGQTYKKNGTERGLEETELAIPSNAAYVRYGCFTELLSSFEASITYRRNVNGLVSDVNALSEECSTNTTSINGLRTDVGTINESQETATLEPVFTHDGYVYADTYHLGQISNNSTVNKYSDPVDVSEYAGGSLTYTKNVSTTRNLAGLVFFDKGNNPIIGYTGDSYGTEKGYTEETVTIPINAAYAMFSFYVDFLEHFSAIVEYRATTYLNGIGKIAYDNAKDIARLTQAVNDLQGDTEPSSTHTPSECRRRFYSAMSEWCTNHDIVGQIIEGPSGYGLGGEVEYETLECGQSEMPIYGVLKLAMVGSSYPLLANLQSEDYHLIKTRGVVRSLVVESRIHASQYSYCLTDHYNVLFSKGGTKSGSAINLVAICDSPTFNGNIVVGCIRTTQSSTETSSVNRYLAMKYLMDIAAAKIANADSDVSTIEQILTDLAVQNAAVVIMPYSNTKLYHSIDFANSRYNLYSKNPANINTMSMIKILTAIVTLDYVQNIDKYVTITSEDITASTGGTGQIFAIGEKITYRDLIYALMLRSSNSAGYILARCVGQYLLDTYDADGFVPQHTLSGVLTSNGATTIGNTEITFYASNRNSVKAVTANDGTFSVSLFMDTSYSFSIEGYTNISITSTTLGVTDANSIKVTEDVSDGIITATE